MKQLLLLISFLLLITLLGCGNDKQGEEEHQYLSTVISEHMGTEVHLPAYKDLDISFVYSYNADGGGKSVDVFYTQDKGKLNKHYSNRDEVKLAEEQMNMQILYGPYDGAESISFSIQNGDTKLEDMSGERLVVNDIEFIVQDTAIFHNIRYHLFIYDDYRYWLGYQLDHYTDEEALSYTQSYIEGLPKQNMESKTESNISNDQPKVLILKDEEGNELASNLDMVVNSAKVSKDEIGILVLEAAFKDHQKLHDITKDQLGKAIRFYYDDVLLTEPVIRGPITHGRFQMSTETLDEDELNHIANIINNQE